MAGVLRQDKRYKYVWETDKVGMIGCDSFRQAACLRAPRARCGQGRKQFFFPWTEIENRKQTLSMYRARVCGFILPFWGWYPLVIYYM